MGIWDRSQTQNNFGVIIEARKGVSGADASFTVQGGRQLKKVWETLIWSDTEQLSRKLYGMRDYYVTKIS